MLDETKPLIDAADETELRWRRNSLIGRWVYEEWELWRRDNRSLDGPIFVASEFNTDKFRKHLHAVLDASEEPDYPVHEAAADAAIEACEAAKVVLEPTHDEGA